MFNTAEDLAKAALSLVEFADKCNPVTEYANIERIEISAAALAVHVVDWHYLPLQVSVANKIEFAAIFPEWGILRQMVNGVKHPTSKNTKEFEGSPDWESDEFWEKCCLPGFLIVDTENGWRPVRSYICDFANKYLEYRRVSQAI